MSIHSEQNLPKTREWLMEQITKYVPTVPMWVNKELYYNELYDINFGNLRSELGLLYSERFRDIQEKHTELEESGGLLCLYFCTDKVDQDPRFESVIPLEILQEWVIQDFRVISREIIDVKVLSKLLKAEPEHSYIRAFLSSILPYMWSLVEVSYRDQKYRALVCNVHLKQDYQDNLGIRVLSTDMKEQENELETILSKNREKIVYDRQPTVPKNKAKLSLLTKDQAEDFHAEDQFYWCDLFDREFEIRTFDQATLTYYNFLFGELTLDEKKYQFIHGYPQGINYGLFYELSGREKTLVGEFALDKHNTQDQKLMIWYAEALTSGMFKVK